jgi:hypothetical protein
MVGMADIDRLRAGPPFLPHEDEGPDPISDLPAAPPSRLRSVP